MHPVGDRAQNPGKQAMNDQQNGAQRAPGFTTRRGNIDLYDETELDQAIAEAKAARTGDFGEGLSEGEAKRLAILDSLKAGSIGPSRSTLSGTPTILRQLEQVAREAPSFTNVVDIYKREAFASIRTCAPMRPLPLILVGPPGVGKTHFVEELGNALGTPMASIAMNLVDDVGELTGHSLSWRSARAGMIAKTLLDEPTASPLIFIDEIEKAPKSHITDKPLDIWHSLFERQNARAFKDAFLGLKLRADHVIWVATANALDEIPEAVIDRTIVVNLVPPSETQQRILAARVYAKFVADRQGLSSILPEESIGLLARHTPRGMIKLLTLAVGFSAERGSSVIATEDIANAQRLLAPAARKHFGFL